MTPLDAEFLEWLGKVYSPRPLPTGDQLLQLEIAFFSGVIAAGVVMRKIGGLEPEQYPPQARAALDVVMQSVYVHIERVRQLSSANVASLH